MSLDEDIYVNLEELEKQAHGQAHSDSRTEGAEAVLASETAHFKVATVCLGVLSLALLVAAVGVGAKCEFQHGASVFTESCPAGWKRFGCRCYILSQVRDNWDRSGRGCRVMGADLAVIKSQEEMMFLNKLLGEKVWIGLSRSSGSWSWTDGSSLMTS
ncbi:asialoglycoprotein receptor 2-like [Eucyclogobius newberryi]|uniref:asialoglycoprotein receptor 2-like n=1 Tax=Eucyclogobius newberryi TaxID=166745 RepID=UPI003B59A9A7